MKKTADAKARTENAVRRIESGETWRQVAVDSRVAVGYLQTQVRKYYGNDKYQELKAMARENKKNRIALRESGLAAEEVIVTETFSLIELMSNDMNKHECKLYMPMFCLEELKQLSKFYKEAKIALEKVKNGNIILVKTFKNTVLGNFKTTERNNAIITTCMELQKLGYNVTIWANRRIVMPEVKGIKIEYI